MTSKTNIQVVQKSNSLPMFDFEMRNGKQMGLRLG
jgi:hypothetical protein